MDIFSIFDKNFHKCFKNRPRFRFRPPCAVLMSCTYVTPRSYKQQRQAASLRTIGRGFFFICSADQNCNYRRRRHCLPCPVLEKSCPKIINLFHFYLFKGWIALLPHELNLNLQNWYHILIHYWAWLLLHLLSRSELQLPAAPPLFTMPGFRKLLSKNYKLISYFDSERILIN